MWTKNVQMFKPDLEKAKEQESKLLASIGSSKKKKNSRKKKKTIPALLTVQNLCVDHKKTVENSQRDGNTRPPDLPPRLRSNS